MKKFLAILGLCWVCCTQNATADDADDIEILTADLSPYSIEVGLRPGFVVEIVSRIEGELGSNRPIDFYPWPRAQVMASKLANKLIFPLTRTADREAHYRWLLDIAPIEYVFVTLNGRVLTMEQAKKLSRITVQQSTPFESFLKLRGFKNLISAPQSADTHLRLLESGRVEAWFTARDLAEFALMDRYELRPTFSDPIRTSRVYVATSHDFPEKVAWDYKRIFEKLKQDGTIDYILKQYRGF